jgi:hypothetical protein
MPNPTAYQQENWYWSDGSGFQFDLPPKDVKIGWTNTLVGDIYDVPALPWTSFAPAYTGWTNWVDKFQPDYRFAATSDANAICQLFPEVSDPWMFTEYVFEGTGSEDAATAAAAVGIVEPPLAMPHRLLRQFINGAISESQPQFLNETPTTFVPGEQRFAFEQDYRWQSKAGTHKTYYESELNIMGWQELVDGQVNTEFTRLDEYRRRIAFLHPSNNAGVALNRVKVWANSTRWGQSQNVPARTLNMTAPADFVRAKDMATDKIVSHVQIIKGEPIYDNADKIGGQGSIYYQSITVGEWNWASQKIGMMAVSPTGQVGVPDANFVYDVPANVSQTTPLVMPKQPENPNSEPAYEWVDKRYDTGALVHRGCAFWKGSDGTVTCDYAAQRMSTFVRSEQSQAIDAGAGQTVISLSAPAATTDTVVEVMVSDASSGPWVIASAGGWDAVPTSSGGSVTAITMTPSGGSTPKTHARIRVLAKNRPIPDPGLCSFYDPDAKDKKAAYRSRAGSSACPYYTAQGQRIVATYQGIASNGAEWANMQRGLPAGYKKSPIETSQGQSLNEFTGGTGGIGGGVVAGLAGAYLANVQTPDPYTAGVPKDDTIHYDVTFGPETIPVAGKQQYYDTKTGAPPRVDPESKLLLRAGTGYHMIDWKEEEAYGGVDTVFFGFVNQINYRLMHSVQHCYRTDKCNPIILGGSPAPGWRRGRYSGVNFTNHPLRPPGYPAFDGSKLHCHYGNHRCPKQNTDRRAVEYSHNYQLLIDEILLPFRTGGLEAFGFLVEKFIENGQIVDLSPETLPDHPTAICVAVTPDSSVPALLGHYQPVVKDASNNAWRVFFWYDLPSWDPSHRRSRVFAHIVQFNDSDEACYADTAVMPDPDKQALALMYGDASKVPWLVEISEDYVAPLGNAIFATNPLPTAGGRNPEYKDLTKRGQEIIVQNAGDLEDVGASGRTATNQFGGPLDNVVAVGAKTRISYWVDKDGEFILKAMPIVDTAVAPTIPSQPPPYVPVEARIYNHPKYFNGAAPIAGEPHTSIQRDASDDGSDPGVNIAQSNYAATGHTYTTDTAALLHWFTQAAYVDEDGVPVSNWETLVQSVTAPDEEGNYPHIGVPSFAPDLLPLERNWYECSKCKVDFSEEEVKFFQQHPQLAVMPDSPPPGAACGCPRGCGGALMNRGAYTHILDTRSRGQIDVWAPPGSTVRRDGFFWKNPTLVSRLHQDQIFHKLGTYNPNGGGYDFSHVDTSVNVMGAMPHTISQFYNAGLNRQLTAPWATKGDSVADVRSRVELALDISAGDVARIHRVGEPTSLPVATGDEGSTTLNQGDAVVFWRTDPRGLVQLTQPIVAVGGPSTLLMNESIVQSDTPRPIRDSFADDDLGERLYRDAIRQWMIGVVQDSLYLWGTAANVGMSENLMAEQLTARGLPTDAAHSFDPKTGETIHVDERVQAPYAQTPDTALGMISIPGLKRLRNRVIPMLAYDLTDPGYTAGGDYVQTQQAGYADRTTRIARKLPIRKWGSIPPQVMAATETGKDYYVEWEVGDILGSTARAYYPVGTTWWRMNQMVGQIKRSGGTNPLHLDDSTESHGIPYTGDVITSVCAFFLHGKIPMHMEVVKAYLVYTNGPGPSAAPLGCQGRYTGYTAVQHEDGPNWDNKEFVGHRSCFFQHYHPWTMETQHEADHGDYAYWDARAKLHTDTYTTWEMRNELPPPAPQSDLAIVPQAGELPADEAYNPWMELDDQHYYYDHVDLLQMQFVDMQFGFGFTQPFFNEWSWGQDITQKVTEYQVWKDIDFAKYDELKERYHTIVKAAVNTTESIQTFDYYAPEFRNSVWARENQGIVGWIDYSSYANSSRFGKKISEEIQRTDASWANGPQIIVQAASDGGNNTQQAGDAERALDITATVRRLYNDRVARFYQCQLGWGLDQLKVEIPKLTDTNLAQAPRMHTGYNEPQFFINYRYIDATYGMWLNDPWHHPQTVGDVVIPPSPDGDPISTSVADREARIFNVTAWDTKGLAADDPDYKKFHPWSLCRASVDLVPDGPIVNPAPQEAAGSFWQVTSDKRDSQSFEMDLQQTPLELSRRAWRHQSPTIDSSQAVCPNVAGCFVAQKGWTVGQFYERATSTWGMNIIPSTTSDHCANCGTKLVGVQYLDGDGITTCTYDTSWEPNPLVSAIQISSSDGTASSPRHGFSIEYFNSQAQAWRPLFEVDYDLGTHKYVYRQWSGSAWQSVSSDTLPVTFVGVEGVGVDPKFAAPATGAHFVIVAASKLRCKVARPDVRQQAFPTDGSFASCVPDAATSSVVVTSLPGNPADFVQRSITLKRTNGTTRDMYILGAEVVANSSPQQVRLTLAAAVTAEDTACKIAWTEYRTVISKFRVFGWPYRTGDVTITPPAISQPVYFSAGNNAFRLNTWATKILRVEASTGDRLGIILQRAEGMDESFLWQVVKDTYDAPHLEISGGQFYFDSEKNQIILPTQYADPDTGELKNIWEMNNELYSDPASDFDLSTQPRQLRVEYIWGTGVKIDVPVVAAGTGPSYQVDKEAVCFIAGHGTDNEDIPGFVQTNASQVLPDMGFSEKISTNGGNPCRLYWQAYNHEPLVWDRSLGWLVGDELGPGASDDESVLSVFSGGNGSDLSEIGPGGALTGKANGKISLYGLPNTILSGNLAVYAKAFTSRTYHLPDGQIVQTAERTGGFRSGAFVFRLTINENVANGRKGVSCGVPRVLVYMRERDLDPTKDSAPLRTG